MHLTCISQKNAVQEMVMGICYLTLEGTTCLHAFLFPHTILAGLRGEPLVHIVHDIVQYETVNS